MSPYAEAGCRPSAPPARFASTAALLVVLGAVGCGGDSRPRPAAADEATSAQVATHVDPCALITLEEVAASVELTVPMHQRQNWTTTGFDVTPEEIPSGMVRVCQFTWSSKFRISERPAYRGVFSLEIMDAAMLPSRGTRTPIPGLADEGFLHGNSAYARVGDLALGVTNLGQANRDTGAEPDAPMIGVLRAASGRLR